MNFIKMQPFVRQALVGNLNKNNVKDVYAKIKTVDCRLFYVLAGGGTMTIEKERYPIQPGTAVLFPAGTEYIWEIESVKYHVVNFDYSQAYAHIRKTFHPIHSALFREEQILDPDGLEDMEVLQKPIVLQNASVIGQIVGQITTEYCLGGAYADMLLSSLLKSAVLTLVRMVEKEEGPRESRAAQLIRSCISYINTNFDTPLTNEEIAEKFHFNSTYLNRVFRNYTGSSIHAFLVSRRITAAMEMLRSQNRPILEVAEKCGFQSLHHFTKTFKKHVGMTPSAYRKQDV